MLLVFLLDAILDQDLVVDVGPGKVRRHTAGSIKRRSMHGSGGDHEQRENILARMKEKRIAKENEHPMTQEERDLRNAMYRERYHGNIEHYRAYHREWQRRKRSKVRSQSAVSK
jgi:hypothetical protein